MKEEIIKNIIEILKEKGVENPKVNLSTSVYFERGDYSTNTAMVYGRELKIKPLDLAGEIKDKLEEKGLKGISVANPGFLNFTLSSEYFADNVKKITEIGNSFGKSDILKGQKTIIEYTDPNPFKEFHIGHLMPNIIGESVARLVESVGAEVKRANYQGDIGLHIAKAVWAIMKHDKPLLSAYAFGHKAYEEDVVAKTEITEINKKIYDKSDAKINKVYEDGKKESLRYFDEIYEKLGTKFDFHFFESEVAGFGKEIVEKNIGNPPAQAGVFEKSDGAVVFKGENLDKKLHTRVFINKDGLPTYEAKELGLAKIKYDKYPYDVSIIITGNEINEYFKVLLKAMSLVFPELALKTKHVSHGMLRLPTGKMSSREGNVISAESLIQQVREKVLEKIKNPALLESSEKLVKGYTDREIEEIAEIVAIGAIKYSILHQAIGGDIVFDFEKSISFDGDSGPYLQYSTVRARSLLKKAEIAKISVNTKLPKNWEVTNLERFLERFPEVIFRGASEYAPHFVATYLIELSSEFNSFYAGHKIIDEKDTTSGYRLALVSAFSQVMTNGLDLLGIRIPDKM